jgi:hypothetical protein
MVQVKEKAMANDQAYEARGVIAKYLQMGHYDVGRAIPFQVPVYRFLTLYPGKGQPAIPVQYYMPAPVIEDKGEVVLDLGKLKPGDFVIHPGLVYRKCAWFSALHAEHLKALPSFKPKDIIVADKADEPAIDIGTIDATSDQVTKQ